MTDDNTNPTSPDGGVPPAEPDTSTSPTPDLPVPSESDPPVNDPRGG